MMDLRKEKIRTPDQVAVYIGTTTKTIMRWIRWGKLVKEQDYYNRETLEIQYKGKSIN